jgi:dTDP-4-amino-4,6-dideoxygalactose transaminase
MDNHHARPTWGGAFQKIRTCFSFTPEIDEVKDQLGDVFKSGLLTNFGKYNCLLEKRLAEFFNVEFAFTVPNASTGFEIILSTLPKDSEVIVPSFTFPATVHTIVHAGLRPIFADIDPKTYNICTQDTVAKITKKTSAILAVHIFGNPCSVDALERIAQKHKIKLFFDSASAFGSMFRDRRIGGCGDAEVFSLSGPKIVTAGEGGIITTNDEKLADRIKCLRNYGISHDKNDCLYIGFNGKLNELSAILALASLKTLEGQIVYRNELAAIYRRELKLIDGIQFQTVLEGCEFNYSFFAIEVDENAFGISASTLKERLKAVGIEAIRYFSPPVHKTTAYKDFNNLKLENTEKLSQNILCLPMHSKLDVKQVQRVCDAIKGIHRTAHARTKRQPMEKVGIVVEAYAIAPA